MSDSLMNSPTLNGETEARSPVTTTKTAGSAALELGAKNDKHTKSSIDFRVTSVSGELAPNEIACLQSACRRSLQRRNFIKLRISAQKLQRAHLTRKSRPVMISSTISASSTKQHRCTVRKVSKSTDIESKGVADVSVGVADVSVIHVGTLPCIVVCMTDDSSSSSASRDCSSPVCIALFDGSSCSCSKRRNCVRLDIAFYKSLETNLKCVEIMSVVDTSFRLYIDLGSVSKNMQFTRDFLQHSSRLPLPVCSVSWWASKSVDDTSTLYDCLARAFSVTGKCALLPNKEKLLKSTESPSEDCCSTGRLSRFLQSAAGSPETSHLRDVQQFFGTRQSANVRQHEDDAGLFFGAFNSSSKKDGKGTLHLKDGSFFEGLWSDDKPTEGAFVDLDGHFSYGKFKGGDGHFSHGNFKGNFPVSLGFDGKVEYANGNVYTGALEDFLPHGYGVYQNADGCKHQGMWKHGKRTGYGEFTNKDGVRNCGNWIDQECNDQLFDLSFCNAGLSGSAVAHTLASVPDTQAGAISFISVSGTDLHRTHAVVLEKFSSLTHLDLSGNPSLSDGAVASILSTLTARQPAAISFLSLSDTGLTCTDVTVCEQLRKLSALQHLDLSSNYALDNGAVSRIITELAGGPEVIELNLSGCSIVSLPDDITHVFSALKTLHLRNCTKLQYLPWSLGSITSLQSVSITEGCPELLYPPKSQQTDAVRTAKFLSQVHKQSEIWRRVKIMFMGNGWGGKTSVLRTLAKQPLQRSLASTRSVTIDALHKDLRPGWLTKFKQGFDVDLSYWDFAGQLEYSLAHHHFMSIRQAVYVVVFSVQDDDDSIAQQLIHWLSVIPDPAACPHIRLIILGTKIDLVPSELLTSVLEAKRKVVQLVIEQKELVRKIQTEDIIFVSSDTTFADPLEPSRTWAICRRGLKNRIYHHCTSIFAGDEQQRLLKYPTACKELWKLVDVLLRELRKKQSLPCCRLDDADAVKFLSSILELPDDDHRRSTYFQTDLVKMALEVLNDLGLIVLYGHGGISQKVPSVCLEPQFLSNIMSVLVESKTAPAVTTTDALIELMEQHHEYSRISPQSSREVKESLVELLESVGIVRRCTGGQKLIVPLALKGRPQCWSDITSKSLPSCVLLALRLGVRTTAFVSSAMFMEVMAAKCADEHRMWGCAFAYDRVDELGTIRFFVRLREDRRSVDIVAVMPNVQGGRSIVHRKVLDEVESIALILGKEFSGDSERMLLCPMCCSSNMFVRFGAAHAFHTQQVACGGVLRCSRFHEVVARDVTDGKLTNLDVNAVPLVYPGRLHELQLPWKQVDECGILYSSAVMNNPQHVVGPAVANAEEHTDSLSSVPKCLLSRHAGEPDVSLSTTSLLHGAHAVVTSSPSIEAVHSPDSAATSSTATEGAFHDGVFTQVSFFVITGQVSTGDTIAADDIPAFRHFLSVCNNHDCCCNVKLTSGESKTLKFSFDVGDTMPNPISDMLPILSILTMPLDDTTDCLLHTKQRFCAHDNVLVVFSQRLESTPYVKPIYLLFPGRGVSIYCRLTPSLCRTDINAACCWSELQDRMAVMMGRELEKYEITSITLTRNEDVTQRFAARLQELEMRAPELDETPHWRKTPEVVAAALTADLDVCKAGIERSRVDGLQLAGMSSSELYALAVSVGGNHLKEQLFEQLSLVKQECEAQEATMRHFEEYTAKFGIRPPRKDVDVNVTVAWWGHKGCNAVYLPIAQNGFPTVPPELKTDPGFFGHGLYFTRYPRYSDYYVSGLKHFAEPDSTTASFLMSFVACGRPFPVTEIGSNPTPLQGKHCSEQSMCCGGAGRHDSHYVSVKRRGSTYYPCRSREQPDYDEIVVFNTQDVLPVAVFEFKRRRRTLLWLDDSSQHNFWKLLCDAPECARAGATQENCMQQRCTLCLHGLNARSNTDTANIDQEVDVVLFTNAAEMKLFLGKHTELSNYPASMLRIISSCTRLHDGLLDFFDADSDWHNTYPAIFALCDDVPERLRERPNFFVSTHWQTLKVFATFKSFSLLPGCSFSSDSA